MTETNSTAVSPERASGSGRAHRDRPRGQVLVLFALLLTFLLGTAAFVVDLAWIWVNELKVQRAADAAALAGVVHLPGSVPSANSSALDESFKNGYQDPSNNAALQAAQAVDVFARPDPADPRRMLVQVSANIDTFFMQIFGFDTLRISRDAKAEFVLPVPMGSPENYYGVFGTVRSPDGGTFVPTNPAPLGPRVSIGNPGIISSSTTSTNTTSADGSCSTQSTMIWSQHPTGTQNTLDDRVATSNNQWITSADNTDRICFGNLGFAVPNPTPPNTGPNITGIEVRIEGFASDTSGCQINVDLMWGAATTGNNTTGAALGDKTLALTGTEPTGAPYTVLGGSGDLWNRSWTEAEIESANFRVRLSNLDPAACSVNNAGTPPLPSTAPLPVAGQVYIDLVQVLVHYQTFTFVPDPLLRSPYDDFLNPRGMWGTFINQGAEKVNGDAYLPKWDPRTSNQNAEYNPNQYYNYAVEMPAGATQGEVWVYDPAFCATDTGGQFGTGDRWFGGSTGATSAYYTLYNTFNTPFDLGDDLGGVVSRAHSIFTNQQADDDTLFASGSGPVGTSCSQGATTNLGDGRYWHNRWYPMQPYTSPGGLGQETPAAAEAPFPNATTPSLLPMTGGNTYRLHTRSTNPTSATAMDNANGHNSFSIWTRAWCSGVVCANAPRVYGLGAMEAFTPLNGGGAAEFYLAEIEPVHAGKSVEIRLWDPGDTGNLPATLRVRYPNQGSYVDAELDYQASQVASGAAACANRSDNTVNPPLTGPLGLGDPYIVTNTGGSSQYNGCWLTIVIVVPSNYNGAAPTALDQNWWKIQYTMGGSAADNAFDLTTWQVTLRGNPVHLVVP